MVPAVAVKVAVVAVAATVTDAGTLSRALLLESETDAPPAGAALERVTVQVEAAPLAKLVGEQARELTVGGATTDTEVVCVVPFRLAESVAD